MGADKGKGVATENTKTKSRNMTKRYTKHDFRIFIFLVIIISWNKDVSLA